MGLYVYASVWESQRANTTSVHKYSAISLIDASIFFNNLIYEAIYASHWFSSSRIREDSTSVYYAYQGGNDHTFFMYKNSIGAMYAWMWCSTQYNVSQSWNYEGDTSQTRPHNISLDYMRRRAMHILYIIICSH